MADKREAAGFAQCSLVCEKWVNDWRLFGAQQPEMRVRLRILGWSLFPSGIPVCSRVSVCSQAGELECRWKACAEGKDKDVEDGDGVEVSMRKTERRRRRRAPPVPLGGHEFTLAPLQFLTQKT